MRKTSEPFVDPFNDEGRWPRWVRWSLIACVAGIFLVVGGVSLLFWYYGRGLPTVAKLRHFQPPQTVRVFDRHGHVLAEFFSERRTVVSIDRVPRVMVLSVLAAEDADFFQHRGLDYPGILRAIYKAVLRGGATQGASTITQQVVKNVLLTPERKLSRKVRELILARRLEQELSKKQILELYLNLINFGHGRYGVEEASLFYFGKHVQDITLAEAAMLAGIPKSPTRLSPRLHPVAAKTRQQFVLSQLARKRAEYWPDLSEQALQKAGQALVPLTHELQTEQSPEVLGVVQSFLSRHVAQDAFKRGGYRVQTTLDPNMLRFAREALEKGLADFDRRHHLRAPFKALKSATPRIPRAAQRVSLQPGRTYRGVVTGFSAGGDQLKLDVKGYEVWAPVADQKRFNPKGLSARQFAQVGASFHVFIERERQQGYEGRLEIGPDGAVVVLDAKTREVLAMVGGYRNEAGFNRALNALRQPGSAFKPIVYASALRTRRYTPATILLDAPEVYDSWRPQNYEKAEYRGAIRLRQALAFSVNTVAVRLMQDIGPQTVVDFAKNLGISTPLESTLALALGSSEVRLIELTNAYATFLAAGVWQPYRLLRSVEGQSNQTIPIPSESPRQPMSAAEAYIMVDLLRSVVLEGTARSALSLGIPAAGKTGTSNDARDAWFIGFTPRWVVGVWVGYDDHRPLGHGEGGGRTALPIWVETVRRLPREGSSEFVAADGVVKVRIDPESGRLAYEGMQNAVDEVFVEGTVPTETATPPNVTDGQTFLMNQMSGSQDEAAAEKPPTDPPQD